jgi:hypothetical protein
LHRSRAYECDLSDLCQRFCGEHFKVSVRWSAHQAFSGEDCWWTLA